jgi:hypothetical protein
MFGHIQSIQITLAQACMQPREAGVLAPLTAGEVGAAAFPNCKQ